MGTYTVEYVSTSQDITDFVHSLDETHLYTDGRIATSSLTLQASFGQFTTNDNSGTTPIINQFDLIKITWTDSDGSFYSKIFEVINNLGQSTHQAEFLLPLSLEGRERNLALIPFSGYFDPPLNHNDMANEILEVYNSSTINSTNQVTINFQSELPRYNPNFWDFQYIDNCLDAIQSVVRLADQSVAAGGAGDRFAIIYTDLSDTAILMDIISQGSTNATATIPIGILANQLFNPIQSVAKIKQPVTGTTVIARGRAGTGGIPEDGDIYRSRLEFYQRFPSWDDSIPYAKDAFAIFGVSTTNPTLITGQVYQALQDNTDEQPDGLAPNWKTVAADEFIGDIQYSRLTNEKKDLYKNECVNPQLAFNSDIEASPKMLDCNIVIDDEETQRDWVYFRSNTDEVFNLPTGTEQYLFEQNKYYPGVRILVDVSNFGTGEGTFDPADDNFNTGAGNDPLGKPYANNAVIFVRGTGNLNPFAQGGTWFVIKEHQDFDQIVSRFDGLFEFNDDFVAKSQFPASNDSPNIPGSQRYRQANVGVTNGWKALGDQFLANDCLHSPSEIINITGLIDPVIQGGGFYTDDSAVRITYEYGPGQNDTDLEDWRKILDQIAGFIPFVTGFLGTFAISAAANLYDLFLTPHYRNAGWWITFTAPWPFNTFNSITEKVGEIYGGQDINELQNHAFFDAFNQRTAFSGASGFNESDSSNLMEITGVTFLYRLNITADGVTIPFTGDIPCSYWCIDNNGTIWKSKQVYRFLNDVQRFTFNFGDFTPVYRARSPFGISNIVTNIIVPELEIRERLFPARIKIQGFMLELSYDEHGRYMPDLLQTIIKPTIFDMFNPASVGTAVQFIGDFDYFQWVKTPLAIAKTSPQTKAIFPEIKDYPNISNLEQLQRAADADLDVENFQFEQYSLVQNDRADVQLQDTVFFKEEFLIPDNDLIVASVPPFGGATTYKRNDLVNQGGSIFISLVENNTGNTPVIPSDFWDFMPDDGTDVINTRELTVAEISLSVTNGRDWERNLTLIRRIPKVTS